jgi:hypothetical protein
VYDPKIGIFFASPIQKAGIAVDALYTMASIPI